MNFRILGPLTALRAGERVDFSGGRQRRLLAMLLLSANHVVSYDRLVDELWSDPPSTARRQVYNAMAALRRALRVGPGEDPVRLHTTDVGYQISITPDQLDAEVFRGCVRDAERAETAQRHREAADQLRHGLALWHGPALSGLGGRHISTAVAGLEEQRLTAMERLAELRLTLDEGTAAIGDLTSWVAENPYREALRGSLMLALYGAGRQAEALTVYEQGRRLLAEHLGLDPGPRLRALHEHILQGTVEPVAAPPAVRLSPPQRPPGLPHEPDLGADDGEHCTLPHDITDFAGRAAELAQLHADAAGPQSTALTICAINGMGGIGKTTLAVRLAHELRPRYAGGQHLVDLRGHTPGQPPMTATAALEVLLRTVGVPAEQIPADLDGRVARWRGEIAGRRMVLVLDNALDEEQVRPLLPGTPGPLVIITSRRYLGRLAGAQSLSLDLLPEPDAVSLFGRIVGHRAEAADPAVLAEVVALCGRLPLAIRIAAARLRHRPQWSVVDLADRLRDQGRRERFLGLGDSTVSAALGLSYGYLPVPLQRMFRLVGLVPAGEIAVGAVAALADVPVDDAEEALDELVEANLVSQGASGRYRLHDLVRDCARGLALRHDPPGDLRTATHRLLDYHLALAWRGCRSIARGPYRFPLRVAYPPAHLPALDSWARALPVLRAEYPTLVEMARFAAENGWPEHAWQLPCALQPFLTRMNYRDNSIELIERALAAARASGAVHGEAAMLGSTALILREQGRFEAAEELFTQAIAISRRLGDRAAVVYQLADLGFTQRRAGRLLQARETFLAGQRLAADTGDDAGYVTLTNNLAVVCIAMGAYADAVGHLSEALAVLQGVGSSQDEILVLGNLGWALTEQGRAGEALPLLARAVQVGRDTGYRHAEAMSLARKASARLQLGDGAGALADARAAVGLAREAHAPYAECEALLVAGNALLAAGAAGAAEDAYQQARDLALGYRLGHLEARGHQAVGELRLRAGDRRAARDCFAAALDLYAGECVEVGQVRRQLVGMTG